MRIIITILPSSKYIKGLHTKMAQVCSRCLHLPIEKIHISETSSDKVPNAASTSGSVSSDLYGMAVKVSDIIISITITTCRMHANKY